METEEVSLLLSEELLRRAETVAVRRGLTLSQLLALAVEEMIENEDADEGRAAERMALLKRAFNLGTNGTVTWTRDELHDRE